MKSQMSLVSIDRLSTDSYEYFAEYKTLAKLFQQTVDRGIKNAGSNKDNLDKLYGRLRDRLYNSFGYSADGNSIINLRDKVMSHA